MLEYTINFTQTVKVVLDETKFTPQFLEEFREHLYQFDSIAQHAEHLAQLHARGLVDDFSFIEGYGPAKDMGICFDIVDSEMEVLHVEPV